MTVDATTFVRPLLAAMLGVTACTAAAAQPPADRNPAEMIKQADADGDGTVSRDEFIKSRTARLEQVFTRMDANGDGKLDAQELETSADQRRAGGRPGPRGPAGERPQRAENDRPQRPGGGLGGAEAFDRLDGDGDGKLSREEFAEGMARMRELMQRNGPGPGGLGVPGGPDRGGRGPEQGFRRPPQQD